MTSKLDNIFKKIAEASLSGGGNNIRDGVYKLAVEKLILNDDAHSGTCFIVEFRVLESSSSGAYDEQGKPVIPNQVGTTCSMVCNISKHESAYGNLRKFLVGALGGLGYSPDSVTDQVIRSFFVDDPLAIRGLVVIDETYRGVNKGRANPANAGKPLTLNKWTAVSQTEDDMAKMRAYLDATPPKAEVAPASTTPATQTAATTTETEKPKSGGLLAAMKRGNA